VHGLVQFIQRCLTFCCIYVGDIYVVLMDNHCIKFRPSVSNDCDSLPPYSLYTSTVFAVDVYTIESPLLKYLNVLHRFSLSCSKLQPPWLVS
jgi:hypothetical protein